MSSDEQLASAVATETATAAPTTAAHGTTIPAVNADASAPRAAAPHEPSQHEVAPVTPTNVRPEGVQDVEMAAVDATKQVAKEGAAASTDQQDKPAADKAAEVAPRYTPTGGRSWVLAVGGGAFDCQPACAL